MALMRCVLVGYSTVEKYIPNKPIFRDRTSVSSTTKQNMILYLVL